ncbi:MAG: hypothetical protein PHV08_07265 [Sulfurovaceae bacterium]|nr:hypothetical protein [Sulfurovaceae bacterium]MDD5407053.1 hypothetical protein [Sulfurovaceae bacterium]
MATPIQCDVLSECYSDTMAMFSRLTLKYNVPKDNYQDDKDRYIEVWLKEIHELDFEDIDYDKAFAKLEAISRAWHDLDDKLFEESEGASKDSGKLDCLFLEDDEKLDVPTLVKYDLEVNQS